MKIVIPPAIRRIMQAMPPVPPLNVEPPTPPKPAPGVDLKIVTVQLLVVFLVSRLVMGLNQALGALVLIVGLLVVVVPVMFLLRQQTKPNQRAEKEYIQALMAYAQAEKRYYDRVAEEHSPAKIKAYRQKELTKLREKLTSFNFALSDHVQPLSFTIDATKLTKLVDVCHQPRIDIPGIDYYIPQFILQSKDKLLTIVVDLEDSCSHESLIREFFQERGVIWMTATQDEQDQLLSEISQIWQTIGL
jgi:c-di-AMP phosphodiesterase-like protein